MVHGGVSINSKTAPLLLKKQHHGRVHLMVWRVGSVMGGRGERGGEGQGLWAHT